MDCKNKLQVSTLAVGKKTEMLATGGGDAVVNLWYDSTASDMEAAFWKERNMKIMLRKLFLHLARKNFINFLSMQENGTRSQSCVTLHSLCFSKPSTSFRQQIFTR